ncbi:MAG TPA: L-aspartate oxidase [Thermoanaerobaculia bacterium]|jgi:L-aspartate oxidase|nr:L-aspartate oxidase [Thermoanaerobaculia bacterium]
MSGFGGGFKQNGSGIDGVSRSEVLVVGSGAAGLTAALGCAPLRATVLTKTRLGIGGSSPWAQGGIAAAVGRDDAPALHAADTMAAGAGLNDPHVVDILTAEGPERVKALLALGAHFDLDDTGSLSLGREAAHSRRRILHARDATGAEVVRTLVEAVRRAPEVRVVDEAFAIDLALEDGRVVGLLAVHADGRRVLHLAPAVVLATGGLGQLYLHTTNPKEATADGLAMAARAGARLVDLEFVQFHPTALATGADPMPLLTEALRGEGAVLINDQGLRFMTAEHPDAELAPRDVVARAIWKQSMAGHGVFLDAREAVGEEFPEHFPTVFHLCREHGLDPRTQPIPVAPAAHYHMGGIAVDDNGRTSLPGLWACGEVAATGAHGANRLASNSLLEALVFGARVADDLRSAPPASGKTPRGRLAGGASSGLAAPGDAELTAAVRRLMWEKAGLMRDEAGLAAAVAELQSLATAHPQASGEARNLLAVGRLVAEAALERRESRGGHYRSDYPESDPAWQRRLFLTATPDGSACFEAADAPLFALAGSRSS